MQCDDILLLVNLLKYHSVEWTIHVASEVVGYALSQVQIPYYMILKLIGMRDRVFLPRLNYMLHKLPVKAYLQLSCLLHE